MSLESLYYRVISPGRRFYDVPVYLLLRVVSVLYRLGCRLNRLAYRWGIFPIRRLGCRVISVGNLTLGGTGKTPIVIMIAETLRGHGFKPAVLSRGYGGTSTEPVNVVCDGHEVLLSAEVAGDEPAMIAERLKNVPVLTGKNRFRNGKYAMDRFGVDTLILDDGFQHRALFRDLNILLFDQKEPLGNGHLFPAGELREPAGETSRADLILVTRSSRNGGALSAGPFFPRNIPVIKTAIRLDSVIRLDNHETLEAEFLQNQPVAAFCGIAKPRDFLKTLDQARARVVYFQPFPDHHRYTLEELKSFDSRAKDAGARFILVPEKDGIKLDASVFSLPVLKAVIDVEILEGREVFTRFLLKSAGGEKTPSSR